jgi:hypothetical protein
MQRNQRLDTAIRDALEAAGCIDEQELAASVARTLRKEGLRSITPESVLAYLDVHGGDVLGAPVQATQSELDFVHIQQRLATRIGTAEGQSFPDVLACGLMLKDPVAIALGDWLQQNAEKEFAVSEELLSVLRAAEAKILQ